MITGLVIVVVGIAWFYFTVDMEIAATVCVVIGSVLSAASVDKSLQYWYARKNPQPTISEEDDRPVTHGPNNGS